MAGKQSQESLIGFGFSAPKATQLQSQEAASTKAEASTPQPLCNPELAASTVCEPQSVVSAPASTPAEPAGTTQADKLDSPAASGIGADIWCDNEWMDQRIQMCCADDGDATASEAAWRESDALDTAVSTSEAVNPQDNVQQIRPT